MKALYSSVLAVLAAVALIGSIGAISLQQSLAVQPPEPDKQFKELTNDFEKNVIATFKDESTGPIPHLRELLSAYIDDVNRILLGEPDTIPPLIQNYERDVTTIFDTQPPEPDKQIKDFRATTHDFVKAVIAACIGERSG